ncbi:FecR family protein [Aquimarina agarilytica]|uniref:FecR family protein n=1 Tax=Aquimarina agarilytica TaxID=1087449 RepID=UPI0012FB5E33|nr:FecR domain-containing protein [Aquimarina agarilytica]
MKDNKLDETFLAKWLSGELTPDQLADFELHPHYEEYVRINKVTSNMSFSDYDEIEAFSKLKNRINTPKKTKVISLYKWVGAVAACLILAIGLYTFNFSDTVYESGIAEHKNITLPDGSTVILNGMASAKVDKGQWDNSNRQVQLDGEAYFKVKKGEKFSVKTTIGTVQVLGTQFTVNTINDDLLIVKCFEGRVSVTTNEGEVILTKGNAYQLYKDKGKQWNFEALAPSWTTTNETLFNGVPVSHVITSLQRQYGVKVLNMESISSDVVFTGSFSNKDLNKALYMVFGTLGVKYEFVSDKEIRILRQVKK